MVAGADSRSSVLYRKADIHQVHKQTGSNSSVLAILSVPRQHRYRVFALLFVSPRRPVTPTTKMESASAVPIHLY